MVYANLPFHYDHYEERPAADDTRSAQGRRRAKKAAAGRRSRKRVAATPTCGMNGRRNRRWSW
jgi:hypothetical protein